MSNILDILNTADLINTDLKPTLIQHGTTVLLKVAEAKITDAADKLSQMFEFKLKTVNPAPGTKGKPLNAGYTITHRISLKEIDKNGADRTEQIKADCAKFRLAVTGSKAGAFMPLEQYLNADVTAVINVQKDPSGQYSDSNAIGRFVPPAGVKME